MNLLIDFETSPQKHDLKLHKLKVLKSFCLILFIIIQKFLHIHDGLLYSMFHIPRMYSICKESVVVLLFDPNSQ